MSATIHQLHNVAFIAASSTRLNAMGALVSLVHIIIVSLVRVIVIPTI